MARCAATGAVASEQPRLPAIMLWEPGYIGPVGAPVSRALFSNPLEPRQHQAFDGPIVESQLEHAGFRAWPWRTSITNASHFTCRTIGQFGGRRPSPCPNLPHLTVVPEAVCRARPGQAHKSKLTPNFARQHRPHHAYLRFPLGSDDRHFLFFSRERDAFAVFLRTLPGCNRCVEIFWRRANRSKTSGEPCSEPAGAVPLIWSAEKPQRLISAAAAQV